MRVACDLQAVTGPRRTGLGVAADLLLRALQEHAPQVELEGLKPNENDAPLRSVLDRVRWEQWRLPGKLREQGGLDLLFSPALGVPLSSPVPTVAYVHDLIPLHYPGQFRGVAGWYWKHLLPNSWRTCSAIAVSNAAVARDVQRLLGFPADRIFVAPYCLDPELAALSKSPVIPTTRTEELRFLCIGTHEPRKNFELAIQAVGLFAAWQESAAVELEIVGLNTPHTAALRELAAVEANQAAVTIHSDYMPRAKLIELIRGATALVFVSRYEGFGLPPLEAMCFGCPVVLSDIPAHRAVYDDNARWARCALADEVRPPFVSTDDPRQLAEALRHIAEDSRWRERLATSGRAYSATFTAEETAAGLLRAFESVVPGSAADGH